MLMRSRGFTLIEVLVALAIGAAISLLTYQALSGAITIESRVSAVSEKTNSIQRAWQLLSDDMQHVVARPWVDNLGNAQPAMVGLLGDRLSQSSGVSIGEDNHLIRFVRSGENNFLQQTRSNLSVVGYRITKDDNEPSHQEDSDGYVSLWRDYWRPIDSVDEPTIKSRLLLNEITSIRFRYLSRDSKDTEDQAWITGWPESTSQNDQLPIAVEVTINLKDMGEMIRLFPLIQGEQNE